MLKTKVRLHTCVHSFIYTVNRIEISNAYTFNLELCIDGKLNLHLNLNLNCHDLIRNRLGLRTVCWGNWLTRW